MRAGILSILLMLAISSVCLAKEVERIYIPTKDAKVDVEYIYNTFEGKTIYTKITMKFYKVNSTFLKSMTQNAHPRDLILLINSEGRVAFYRTNINEKCFRIKYGDTYSRWFYLDWKDY